MPLVICGGPFKGGKEVTELVSTESIPKTLLALAGVDVGAKMIGENLLDIVEKKNHNRANEVYAQISESRCGGGPSGPHRPASIHLRQLHAGRLRQLLGGHAPVSYTQLVRDDAAMESIIAKVIELQDRENTNLHLYENCLLYTSRCV